MSIHIKNIFEKMLQEENFTPQTILNYSKNKEEEKSKRKKIIFQGDVLNWGDLSKDKKLIKIKSYLRLNCIECKEITKFKFKDIKYDKKSKTIKTMSVVLK